MNKRLWIMVALVIVLMTTLLLSACQQTTSPSTSTSTSTSTTASTPATNYATGGTIKISYSCPPGKGYSAGEEWFGPAFQAATNNRWKVEVYGASTLVPITAVLDSVRSGVCQIGLTSAAQFAKDFPLTMLTQVMGLGWPGTAVASNWWDAAVPAFAEYANIPEVNAELNNGFIYSANDLLSSSMLVMKNKQVHVPADLKGTKIGAIGAFAEVVSANGGATVAVVTPELYMNLDKGVIDGASASAVMVTDWKIQTICNYFFGIDMGTGTMLVLYNKDFYNSLSPQDKQLFDQMRAQALPHCLDFMKNADIAAYKTLADQGKPVTMPTASDITAWNDTIKTIMLPKWRSDAKSVGISDAVLDKVYNSWVTIRAKYWKQYNLPGEPSTP
jgi:TRAP-type C4-dicarboxylate transport system substrate-binding protein